MCRSPGGENVPTPGVSEQGGKSSGGGGSASFSHGPDVTTTVTAEHTYLNGIQLPGSAPDSATLAELVAKRIPDYRDDAAGRYMGGGNEFTYKDIIAIIVEVCAKERGACSNEFAGWAISAKLAVSPAMVSDYVAVEGGPAAVGSVIIGRSLAANALSGRRLHSSWLESRHLRYSPLTGGSHQLQSQNLS